jgi:hypothetical protein
MKIIYPLRNVIFYNNNIELYKFGIEHYEKQLRLNKIK